MLPYIPILLALVGSAALAFPTNLPRAHHDSHDHADDAEAGAWNEGAVSEYPIHSSCNATETTQLRAALHEMEMLAEHAKEHVLRWSNNSAVYRKYFGDGSSAAVLGNFDRVANGDKASTLFRCDDPDGNCQLPEWGGHWRGENGTDETVICPLSYSTQNSLAQLCAFGYNVAEWPTNTYFASDLLHRVYHMPAISEWYVDHYTEDYAEVLEMAQNNNTFSVHDSDTLQYFALEVYAHDIAVPGEGCPGPRSSEAMEASSTVTSAMESSTMMSVTTSMDMPSPTSPSATLAEAASVTLSIPEGCHTHEGGEMHCD